MEAAIDAISCADRWCFLIGDVSREWQRWLDSLRRQRHAVDFAGFRDRKPELAVPDGHAMRLQDDAVFERRFRGQHELHQDLSAGGVHFEERAVDALGAPEWAVRIPADAMRAHAGGGEGALHGAVLGIDHEDTHGGRHRYPKLAIAPLEA